MENTVINTHDFKEAKLSIKKFSEQTTTDFDLNIVNEKKSLGKRVLDIVLSSDFSSSHKVTGSELNELTCQIQEHLISVNDTQINIINQFGQVYTALEALDKDYIQAILVSIKATEETSKSIKEAQVKIGKIVDDQKSTLKILLSFKQKLDSYAHLGDIDNIWNDYQKWHNEISTISYSAAEAMFVSSENTKELTSVKESIEDTDGKIVQLSETVSEHTDRMEFVSTFMNELETMTHLKDVDEMWCKVEDNSKNLDILTEQSNNSFELVQQNRANIVELTDYKHELSSIAHLKDVDNLWVASEKHSSQIKELQDQDEELRNLIQRNKELTDQAIAVEKEKTNAILQQLNKKIQYAYWIAGGAMAFALVELLVILLR